MWISKTVTAVVQMDSAGWWSSHITTCGSGCVATNVHRLRVVFRWENQGL